MKNEKLLKFVNAKIAEFENVKHWVKLCELERENADLKDEIESLKNEIERLTFLGTGETEKELVVSTLKKCQGDKMKAAKVLGITVKTLYVKLHEWKIE